MVFALGRVYWWFEAPWLGVMLAVGLASLTCAILIELNREQGVTLIVVTHDPLIANRLARRVEVHQGLLREAGSA